MATNESNNKLQTKSLGKSEGKNSVAKSTGKGLIHVAEVRMVLYVVPVAISLAIFVYLYTNGYGLFISLLIPFLILATMFAIVMYLLKKTK